jgi:hypothetical protein
MRRPILGSVGYAVGAALGVMLHPIKDPPRRGDPQHLPYRVGDVHRVERRRLNHPVPFGVAVLH